MGRGGGGALADRPRTSKDDQRYSERGAFSLTIPGQPGTVRVTVTIRDTVLTCKQCVMGAVWPDNPWTSRDFSITWDLTDSP